MEFVNYTSYNKVEDIKRLKFITENLPSSVNGTLNILDIGCGNGNISYQLARYGHRVTGIDISQTTIRAAIARYGNTPGLKYKVANAENLQLSETEKYDAIICSEILEHLYHPENLVKNFKNLLKKEGVAIVTVPNGYGPREFLITRPIGKIQSSNGILAKAIKKIKNLLGYKGYNKQTSAEYLDHIQFFTMKKLTSLANTGGFSIMKKQAGNFVENVFPFSLLTRRLVFLQKIDCLIADLLPLAFTSAFYSVWKNKN